MTRLLAVSILLTVVYSWEEFKRAVRVLFYRVVIRKRPLFGDHGAVRVDKAVSTLVIFATVPAGLMYLLAGPGVMWQKVGILAVALVGVSMIALASSVLMKKSNVLSAGFSAVSLFYPLAGVAGGAAVLSRRMLAKFALYLSIPPAAGLLLRFTTIYSGPPEEILPNLDILIMVLMGALFAQIAAEFLSLHFRLYKFTKLFSYYRVALGVLLAWFLLV